MEADLLKKAEQSPKNLEIYLLIEMNAKQIEKHRIQLEENSSWPSTYLYKFIVPTDQAKIDQIYAIFDQNGVF